MITPSRENLLRLQTEITYTRAQHKDLTFRVRRRELVEGAQLETALYTLAHRIRDQLLTAPARHAAIIGSEFGIAPAALAEALEAILRAVLTEAAAAAR